MSILPERHGVCLNGLMNRYAVVRKSRAVLNRPVVGYLVVGTIVMWTLLWLGLPIMLPWLLKHQDIPILIAP